MNVKDRRPASALCNVPELLCDCFPLHSCSVVTLAFLARSDSNGPLVSTETCRGVYRDCSDGAAPRAKPLLCFTAVRANEERSFGKVQDNYLISDPVSSCICMDHSSN